MAFSRGQLNEEVDWVLESFRGLPFSAHVGMLVGEFYSLFPYERLSKCVLSSANDSFGNGLSRSMDFMGFLHFLKINNNGVQDREYAKPKKTRTEWLRL
jgi:hypothetical protein